MSMSPRDVIRSVMSMVLLSLGRKISVLFHPSDRPIVVQTSPPLIWTGFSGR